MRLSLLVLILLLVLPPGSVNAATMQQEGLSVVINEIQTGGLDETFSEDGKQEFIEIHNTSDTSVDITEWKLQYFSATREDVFTPAAQPTRELMVFDGLIAANGYVLLSYVDFITNADLFFGQGSTAASGLLAKSGGHVRLTNGQELILDVVAWGTAKFPETKALPEISAGKSVERKTTSGLAVDTNNNFEDFLLLDITTPRGGALSEPLPPVESEPIIPVCDGLVITEVFPNPDGTDTEHEFIELFNPTDASVNLDDCVLSTASSTKLFYFPSASIMQPKQFKAFYDSETGLTLANAAGGQVILRGTNTEYSVSYPVDMAPGQSYSLIEQQWYISAQPTPSALNILPSPQVLAENTDNEVMESCGVGRYRNPETNRCRNMPTTLATITNCAPGQTRNPETNRCRNVASLASVLIPCREGQERSPETNRCRNVANTSQTKCQEGYERNEETNRCRKIVAALAASPSVGSLDTTTPKRLNYVFLTLMSLVVLGYGVFEYRRDISNGLVKLQTKRLARLASK